ncbi:transcription regulator protein BACH1b [Mugil cephalus]|uniref:transcription regulator protein BACH1b n=1 Tax=Mugil cephalus TaxID=48193 RepID=UPI001FB859E1|nr:transcription regulator protein BACH1b [Mugil cephalus]
MSLIAMSAPRSSVFTFESSVHSSHVLHSLDEQRRRDMLCDVTVVVEGQSFRAHRSVLASCSEYFTQRISSLTQHGAVITLPPEVTAAGFEPLLKFAYTSKLLFGKHDVLEIRNSASILGFRDFDEACFEFLLPKFLSSSEGSFTEKTCCKKKCNCGTDSDEALLDEKEVKPVADSSSQQEVLWDCNKSVTSKMGSLSGTDTLAPAAEATNGRFMQCPKYRKFQQACGKETCVTDKSLTNQVAADDSKLSCLPCPSYTNSKNETETKFPGNSTSNAVRPGKKEAEEPWKTQTHDLNVKNEMEIGEINMKMEEEMPHTTKTTNYSVMSNVRDVSLEPNTKLGKRSSGLILHQCPQRAASEDLTGSLGQEGFDTDIKEDRKARPLEQVPIHQKAEATVSKRADNPCPKGQKGGQCGSMERVAFSVNNTRERSTMEKEVAEHLAQRLGSDSCFSQLNPQDPEAGSSADAGMVQSTPSEWLAFHSNFSSTRSNFFQDVDQRKCLWKAAGLSECEGASQSGVSSLTSGEDGDSETETEGDSESYTRERARQIQLPFSVDWIVDLSRNDFQQLLKQHEFTREQLEFVHDMRRRSKNRLAAQRCRKRKLDCIYNLQCEINKLKTEREKLIVEKSHLSQLKQKTCRSVSSLCQRVCGEAGLQPEQLQVLAKYTSPDCPLSSILPHIDRLLLQHGMPLQPQVSLVGPDMYTEPEDAPSTSGRDTVTGQRSL